MSRNNKSRRVNYKRRLNVTAISDMLGVEVDRHGSSRDEHVDNVADHPPHHQRINRGSHGKRENRERIEIEKLKS